MFNRDHKYLISLALLGPVYLSQSGHLGLLTHLPTDTLKKKSPPKDAVVHSLVPARAVLLLVGQREEAGSACFALTQGCNRHRSLDLASHLLLFASRRAELVRHLTEQCRCFCSILSFGFFILFLIFICELKKRQQHSCANRADEHTCIAIKQSGS